MYANELRTKTYQALNTVTPVVELLAQTVLDDGHLRIVVFDAVDVELARIVKLFLRAFCIK